MKKPKHGRQHPDQSSQTSVLLATDQHNSVLAELKNDDLNEVRYSAYGQRSAELNPAASMAFNGEFREPDTGWYLLGNGYRAYNPVLMRFHSPDSLSPFGKGGLNPYAYCVGDPVNHTDPTGHFAFSMLSQVIYSVSAVSAVAGATSLTASFFVKDDNIKKNLRIAGGSLLAAGLGVAGAKFTRLSSTLRKMLQRSNAPTPRLRSRSSVELEVATNMFSSQGMQEARAAGRVDPIRDVLLFRDLAVAEAARGRNYLPPVDVLFPNRHNANLLSHAYSPASSPPTGVPHRYSSSSEGFHWDIPPRLSSSDDGSIGALSTLPHSTLFRRERIRTS